MSSYLRKMRTYLEVSAETFAASLDVPPSVIVQLEKNGSEPWLVPAVVMAGIVQIIRLHILALEVLTKNSHTIARLSTPLFDSDAASASMTRWLNEVRSELQRHGATELLD